MKKTLVFIGVLAMTACSSSAQKTETKKESKDTPKVVTEAFAKKYSNVQDVDWEKEENNFEAEFEMNGKEYSAVFDEAGKFIEEESEIDVAALPKAVTDYLATNHKGKKVKEAAQIKLADGTINYEAEVHGKDLIFDQNGKLIH